MYLRFYGYCQSLSLSLSPIQDWLAGGWAPSPFLPAAAFKPPSCSRPHFRPSYGSSVQPPSHTTTSCRRLPKKKPISMKKTSTQPKYTDRIRSWARTHGGTHRASTRSEADDLAVSNPRHDGTVHSAGQDGHANHQEKPESESNGTTNGGVVSPAATSSQVVGSGTVVEGETDKEKVKKNVVARFLSTTKTILFYSKLNLMLVFVPIGIVVELIPGMSPGLIFAMNALAIIPLAGLLSFATETVARRLGDSLGALLNVTFGNAVELIIL